MNSVLINTSDKAAYSKVMTDACYGPDIIEDLDNLLRVNFCSAAMTFWVQAGYWYLT
jgi:hypothetical protein